MKAKVDGILRSICWDSRFPGLKIMKKPNIRKKLLCLFGIHKWLSIPLHVVELGRIDMGTIDEEMKVCVKCGKAKYCLINYPHEGGSVGYIDLSDLTAYLVAEKLSK